MVSPTEKCGGVRTGSLSGRLAGRLFDILSDILSIRPFAMLSRAFDKLSVELVGSGSFLGSAVRSGVDVPRVSTKAPPMGSCVDTLSMAKGGGVASSCLESAM